MGLRSVEKIHARAKKAKVTIESGLRDWPYGRAFTITTPTGTW
ncbi:MAG: hypothetical protein ACREDK_03405 [Thermoplasmata archaeon]